MQNMTLSQKFKLFFKHNYYDGTTTLVLKQKKIKQPLPPKKRESLMCLLGRFCRKTSRNL